MLLTAEQEAQYIISSARNCKIHISHSSVLEFNFVIRFPNRRIYREARVNVFVASASFLLSFTFPSIVYRQILFYFIFFLGIISVRTTRLKQAKDEAEREMAVYRSNIEAEYQKKIAEVW